MDVLPNEILVYIFEFCGEFFPFESGIFVCTKWRDNILRTPALNNSLKAMEYIFNAGINEKSEKDIHTLLSLFSDPFGTFGLRFVLNRLKETHTFALGSPQYEICTSLTTKYIGDTAWYTYGDALQRSPSNHHSRKRDHIFFLVHLAYQIIRCNHRSTDMIIAGGAALWLKQGGPTSWYPEDVDLFVNHEIVRPIEFPPIGDIPDRYLFAGRTVFNYDPHTDTFYSHLSREHTQRPYPTLQFITFKQFSRTNEILNAFDITCARVATRCPHLYEIGHEYDLSPPKCYKNGNAWEKRVKKYAERVPRGNDMIIVNGTRAQREFHSDYVRRELEAEIRRAAPRFVRY